MATTGDAGSDRDPERDYMDVQIIRAWHEAYTLARSQGLDLRLNLVNNQMELWQGDGLLGIGWRVVHMLDMIRTRKRQDNTQLEMDRLNDPAASSNTVGH